MHVRGLGYRTALIFPRFNGEVTDRGDYTVIRTPSNPTFHWGNYLLFADAPGPGDYDRWRGLFHKEIGPIATVGHYAFGWDRTDGQAGEVAPFEASGFSVSKSVVLTAREVARPGRYNDEAVVRPLRDDDAEWEAAIQNQIACRGPEYELEGYTVYKRRQMADYRAMVRAGLGHWFGAFLGGRLAGDFGVFADGEGDERLARFQQVGVHPDYRRRGVCHAMIHQASERALREMGAKTLVMVADPDYHAARIYESVGFRPAERQVELSWWRR